MSIRTMILDDDVNSQKAAVAVLSAFSDIEITGRFASWRELEKDLKNNTADVLFLDIEMGEDFGFNVARALMDEYPELMIVFLTGHSSYAIDGYDFNPVNFLTKPINPIKLAQTIEEIRRRMKSRKEQRKAQLMLRLTDGYRIIDVREIIYVEHENRKNYVCLDGGRERISGYTMKELEGMLSEYGFFLCHQSFIINLFRVRSLKDAGCQLYEAELEGAEKPVPVSRNRYECLKNELESLGIINI